MTDVYRDYGDFAVLKEELLCIQICSQLPPDEASHRLNEERGHHTVRGWFFVEEAGQVECEDRPDYVHYVFEC